MTPRSEIIESWRTRLAEWQRFGTLVSGETVAAQVLADIASLSEDIGDESLSLTEASKEGGVSTRQLARLVQQGKLVNVGRKNAPRVRRKDIPRKAALADSGNVPNLQVIREAVGSKLGQRGRSHGT